MPKGEKIPRKIADYLAVESYLNGFGHKKLTKMLSEKDIELSHEGVRRVKNARRKELEEAVDSALRRLKSRNEVEALHTLVSLRLIDIIVSNLETEVVKHFCNNYFELTIKTLRVLFDASLDYSNILRNVELVDMFIHHRELEELEDIENENRVVIDIVAVAFTLISSAVNSTGLEDERTFNEKRLKLLQELLRTFYDVCTKILDLKIQFGLTEKEFFFLMIKGMVGCDEDYENYTKSQDSGGDQK